MGIVVLETVNGTQAGHLQALGAVSVTTEMTLLAEHLRTCQKASEFERGF